MRTSLHLFVFLFFILMLVRCASGDDSAPDVPQSVIDKALNIFPGEVIEKSEEIEEGIDSWEIKIQNQNGSIAEFYYTKSNEDLVKIEGIQGPFDYDLNPGMGLLSFSAARTAAIAAVKNTNITEWQLKKESKFINKWVYSFEIDKSGSMTKVYVDAVNAEILEID